MKRQKVFKMLLGSIILLSFTTSCGYFKKWTNSETPTDSKAEASDDLFSNSANDATKETALASGTDAPSNISTEESKEEVKEVAKEDIFKEEVKEEGKAEAKAEAKAEVKEAKDVLPQIKEEIAAEPPPENSNTNAGKTMSYKVRKGETLMQIAFKIYGDLSKWKDLKNMNHAAVKSNSSLIAGMNLKYVAPKKKFVWKPIGAPHMIKNGETLGTISKLLYKTQNKWKSIWENNKPLIKNPNVIYAGFTLYCNNKTLADGTLQQQDVIGKIEVENQEEQIATQLQDTKVNDKLTDKLTDKMNNEEVKIAEAIEKLDKVNTEHGNEIDLTKETQSAPIRNSSGETNQVIND